MRTYNRVTRAPVTNRLYTKLRYSEGLTFTCSVADTLYPWTFQSSAFDPDLSGVGHQPLWRDQYATMYNRYRVSGIAYRIYVKNTNSVNLSMFFVQHSSTTVTDTSLNTLIERKNSRKLYLDSNANKANYLKGYMSVGRTYGMNHSQFLADDSFDALIGANPTKLAYLHLYCLGRASFIANCQVELTFYVEFFDRINVSGS